MLRKFGVVNLFLKKGGGRIGNNSLTLRRQENRDMSKEQPMVAYDATFRDKDGNTQLMLAASEGNVEAMQLFITQGADVNAVNKYKETALIVACEAVDNSVEAMKLLITNNADVTAKDHNDETALIWASRISK